MGSLSDYAEGVLLDHIFNSAYSKPATVYLCLCTANPTDAGTGASMNEHPDSQGYARTAIAFGAAAARRITQNAEVAFPSASGTYTEITNWAICDSATHGAGNMLAYGTFTTAFTPVAGNTPKVASGQVYIEISATAAGAGFTTYCVNLMLDMMFRNQTFTSPAGNTFVAIYTATLADADDDTTDKAEENATEYVRTEVNPNGGSSPTWDLADSGVVDNTHEIVLEASVGTDDWDTDVALAVVSTGSGAGKIYCYDNANVVDQRPRAGDSVKVAVGAFNVALS